MNQSAATRLIYQKASLSLLIEGLADGFEMDHLGLGVETPGAQISASDALPRRLPRICCIGGHNKYFLNPDFKEMPKAIRLLSHSDSSRRTL